MKIRKGGRVVRAKTACSVVATYVDCVLCHQPFSIRVLYAVAAVSDCENCLMCVRFYAFVIKATQPHQDRRNNARLLGPEERGDFDQLTSRKPSLPGLLHPI